MLRIGEKQVLEIVREVAFGVYLAEGAGAKESVLLPRKEIEPGMECGSRVEVFLYKDSSDRLIATKRRGADSGPESEGGYKDRSLFGLGTGKGSSASFS